MTAIKELETYESSRRHRLGVILMLTSATVFSTAGLFTKGVSAEAWSVIFWRGLFAALFTTLYLGWKQSLRYEFLEGGWPGVAVAILGASGTAAFIPAFKNTSIANVSLIYAMAPFVAVAVAWLWFRERPTHVVVIAACFALLGAVIVLGGSLGGVNLRGDLLAFWMTLMMSTVMVVYRRYPDTPGAGPAVMASLILLPISAYFGDPFSAPFDEILILMAFGVIFAIASVTLQEGAKRLPPGEASLISALETPLAPIWAFLMFSELPPAATWLGGCIILVAVFGSQLSAKRAEPVQ